MNDLIRKAEDLCGAIWRDLHPIDGIYHPEVLTNDFYFCLILGSFVCFLVYKARRLNRPKVVLCVWPFFTCLFYLVFWFLERIFQ